VHSGYAEWTVTKLLSYILAISHRAVRLGPIDSFEIVGLFKVILHRGFRFGRIDSCEIIMLCLGYFAACSPIRPNRQLRNYYALLRIFRTVDFG